MARYAQGTRIDFPEITAIKRELAARFAPNIRAKFLGAALNKATKPVARSLKQNTKKTFKRVSGNLERSVANVVRRYVKTGNAVGIVGYTKAGGKKFQAGRLKKERRGRFTLACSFSGQSSGERNKVQSLRATTLAGLSPSRARQNVGSTKVRCGCGQHHHTQKHFSCGQAAALA